MLRLNEIGVCLLIAGTLASACTGLKSGEDSAEQEGASARDSGEDGEHESALSCRLQGERGWMQTCNSSASCGDVMTCFRICKNGCDTKCRVPCKTSEDCAAVGAGTCTPNQILSDGYAVDFNYCTDAPTKCPARLEPAQAMGGAGQSSSGGCTLRVQTGSTTQCDWGLCGSSDPETCCSEVPSYAQVPGVDCDGRCTDLASDAQNCGACGEACGRGEQCHEGECVVPAAAGRDAGGMPVGMGGSVASAASGPTAGTSASAGSGAGAGMAGAGAGSGGGPSGSAGASAGAPAMAPAGGSGGGMAGGSGGMMGSAGGAALDAQCLAWRDQASAGCKTCGCTPSAANGCRDELAACANASDAHARALCMTIVNCGGANDCIGSDCSEWCPSAVQDASAYASGAPLAAATRLGTCLATKCGSVCP